MDFGNVGVPAITMLCYLVGAAVKASSANSKYIPIICGTLGAILGIAAMFAMPDFPANDVLTAAAIGAVSGLAATGANQVFKQLKGDDDDV